MRCMALQGEIRLPKNRDGTRGVLRYAYVRAYSPIIRKGYLILHAARVARLSSRNGFVVQYAR